MNAAKKSSCFLLIFLVASSFLAFQTASAQSKPSTPEFTIRYVDYSYVTQATYGVDQYSGQAVITGGGERIDNRSVEFTIKNQPFTPYIDTSGNNTQLFYNFRFKGIYGDTWSYHPFKDGQTTHSYGPYSGGLFKYYNATNAEYTIVSVSLNQLTIGGTQQIPTGAQVQFEVQAQKGHIDTVCTGLLAGDYYSFVGESSDWSSPQTITVGQSVIIATPTPSSTQLPSNNSSYTPIVTLPPTQSPTVTPLQPNTQAGVSLGADWELAAIIVLFVAVAVLIVMVAVQQKSLRNLARQTPRNRQ